MIGSIDEALNKNTLDKLWNDYTVDARQRKITDTDKKMCKELHIATRWSVHDVIGRLQRIYEDDPTTRARFIAIPDIDEETGESNFEYESHGYTVQDFEDIQKLMDEITYNCLYKQQPVEREGLLYHADELRRYETLPDREPDAVWGVCDTKTTGIDFMFLPVVYVYDSDHYLVDCICDDTTDFNVQHERVSNIILAHHMQEVEFESNAGGSRFAFEIAEIVKKAGGMTNITTKPTETNKETRIIVNSDWIKKNVLFKDPKLYQKKSDYGRMMDFLLSWTTSGKNKHDDVPDGLANYAIYVARKLYVRETTIIANPFRR
jgi:predicted phage terminase large subunit-like protein